jgi:methionyl-tRNA formyltransferase
MPVNNPAIVFMGTPEFAVASLDAIIHAGFTIKGVVTSPDKPSGRGLQLHPSPVKKYALEHHLPVLQPLKLKDPVFLKELQNLGADLQVIVAFRMLPMEVWSMPPLGTFNLHASLLPQFRGAAPINWAIINGETKTGVTTFFLNDEIDKGSVIYSNETPIGENETAGEVHDRLMIIGAQLVVKTISDIVRGKVEPVEQQHMANSEPLKPAPKIFKNDCRIQWNDNADKIHDFVRGLSPYPAAWSTMILHDGEILSMKIYNGRPEIGKHELFPGAIVSDGKQYLKVAVVDGFYYVYQLQIQGRKQITVNEFLRGFNFERILKCN